MLTPASSAKEVLDHLLSLRKTENLAGMARFGIVTETALGLPNPLLRQLARALKTENERAEDLWTSGIREARLLASFTTKPALFSADRARRWADDLNSWEVVDAVADLFVAAGLGPELIPEFAADEREFVRRTAFSMIAVSAVHLKKEPDEAILCWLPLIEHHSTDPRNFVRKAVNWALRQIGKRSRQCHAPALALATRLAGSNNATQRWIGKDAVRELNGAAVLRRLGLES